MRLGYSAVARTDLSRIRLDYELRASQRIADETFHRITDTLQRVVARHPNAGRLRPELGSGIRSFPIVPYVAFYRVERTRVIVVRIVHGKRDISPPIMSFLAVG